MIMIIFIHKKETLQIMVTNIKEENMVCLKGNKMSQKKHN